MLRGHDGETEGDHSLSGRAGTMTYVYSWPAIRWGRRYLLWSFVISAGVFFFVYCEQKGVWEGGIVCFVFCMIGFGAMLWEALRNSLELWVKQDEIRVRTPSRWRVHPRADILGIEADIPAARELSVTRVHFKKRIHCVGICERWREPTMIRDADSGDERELTSLLVELFGVHVPESRNPAQPLKRRD